MLIHFSLPILHKAHKLREVTFINFLNTHFLGNFRGIMRQKLCHKVSDRLITHCLFIIELNGPQTCRCAFTHGHRLHIIVICHSAPYLANLVASSAIAKAALAASPPLSLSSLRARAHAWSPFSTVMIPLPIAN